MSSSTQDDNCIYTDNKDERSSINNNKRDASISSIQIELHQQQKEQEQLLDFDCSITTLSETPKANNYSCSKHLSSLLPKQQQQQQQQPARQVQRLSTASQSSSLSTTSTTASAAQKSQRKKASRRNTAESTTTSTSVSLLSTNTNNTSTTTNRRKRRNSTMSSMMITTEGKNRGRSGTQQRRSPNSTSEGCLQVTVLSAYDLPVREPPLCVSVQVGNGDFCPAVQTGPPAQRHKDRNSFKFSSNGNHLNELEIYAPLPKLYAENVRIEILYEKNSSGSGNTNNKLVASYPLSQLRMAETTWLILHMDGTDDRTDTGMQVGPTLRLHMTLSGPFRPEVAALVNLAQAWFVTVDDWEQKTHGALQKLPPLPDPKYLIIPAVPVAALALVSAPILIGVLTIGLPFVLPIVSIMIMLGVAGGGLAWMAYCSTAGGRAQLAGMLSPLMNTLMSTSSGQRLIYQTGPRPSPVQLAKVVVPKGMWHKAVMSLVIDFIGSSSYLIPIAGEVTDIAWAPLQTIFIMAMYEETSSNLKYLSFAEEFLPFTDIVPSATLGWLMEFGVPLVLNGAANVANGGGAAAIATTNTEKSHLLLQQHQQQEPGEPSSNLPEIVAVTTTTTTNDTKKE